MVPDQRRGLASDLDLHDEAWHAPFCGACGTQGHHREAEGGEAGGDGLRRLGVHVAYETPHMFIGFHRFSMVFITFGADLGDENDVRDRLRRAFVVLHLLGGVEQRQGDQDDLLRTLLPHHLPLGLRSYRDWAQDFT